MSNEQKEKIADKILKTGKIIGNTFKVIKTVLAIIAVVFWVWVIYWFISGVKEQYDKDFGNNLDKETKLIVDDVVYSPVYTHASMDSLIRVSEEVVTNPDGSTTKKAWSAHVGDYKKCRKDFQELIAACNPPESHATYPQIMNTRIDGDTLWIESYQYRRRDPSHLADDYAEQFRDCKFARVNVMAIDAGGQPYRVIWDNYQKKEYTKADLRAAQRRVADEIMSRYRKEY